MRPRNCGGQSGSAARPITARGGGSGGRGTRGGPSRFARQQTQDLSMGVGHAGSHPDYPGLVSERYISENNQRLFYRRWEQFMNAGSWADIPLDPIRARFEGTATMRG